MKFNTLVSYWLMIICTKFGKIRRIIAKVIRQIFGYPLSSGHGVYQGRRQDFSLGGLKKGREASFWSREATTKGVGFGEGDVPPPQSGRGSGPSPEFF